MPGTSKSITASPAYSWNNSRNRPKAKRSPKLWRLAHRYWPQVFSWSAESFLVDAKGARSIDFAAKLGDTEWQRLFATGTPVDNGWCLASKVFEPTERHLISDGSGLRLVLIDSFAPVKAKPAARDGFGTVDKLIQLRNGTVQGEHFFNEDRFADVVNSQSHQRFINLAVLRVKMQADEVELPADLFRIEQWLSVSPGQSPGNGPDGQ